MNDRVDRILQEFASQSLEIEGAFLVSSQGQPITVAMGMEYNSALILAGTMLRLAQMVREEYTWQEIEQVSIRAQEGYVILFRCSEEIFLLVKTARVPWGFLDRDIHRTVRTLQTELQTTDIPRLTAEDSSQLTLLWENRQITAIDRANTKSQLDRDFIARAQQELAQYIGPIASVVCKRVLSENPNIEATEFIKAIAKHIPKQQQALDFQRHFLF
jgi:predicted regulator of Ras-like GTPase activity (Roadblock/LC7/MglB family)